MFSKWCWDEEGYEEKEGVYEGEVGNDNGGDRNFSKPLDFILLELKDGGVPLFTSFEPIIWSSGKIGFPSLECSIITGSDNKCDVLSITRWWDECPLCSTLFLQNTEKQNN